MNTDSNKNKDLEIEALASLVSSFFENRIGGEEGKLLSRLTSVLTKTVSSGSSHLLAEEANLIFDNWKSLPAIGDEDVNLPLVCTDSGKLYFRRFYEFEKSIADVLRKKCTRVSAEVSKDTEEFFRKLLSNLVDDQQALAVGAVLIRDLVLLTGGPGTGKTRTIVAMLAAYIQKYPRHLIALAAPTGKAAFRMRESVLQNLKLIDLPDSTRQKIIDSTKATTLHRLLGSRLGSVDFQRNKKNPLPFHLVVVDEASMIDLSLMAKLCDALREETKLVLIGDADQLAPVNGGAVFNGLIKSSQPNEFRAEDLPKMETFSDSAELSAPQNIMSSSMIQLSRVHRRSDNNSSEKIGELCTAIKEGNGDEVASIIHSDVDSIKWISDLDDPQLDSLIYEEFNDLSVTRIPDLALSKLGKFRILCANNDGRYGVANWNTRSETILPKFDVPIRPVVVHVNDYTVGLYNGDDGIVLGSKVYFQAEDGIREIARSRLPQHKIGYASTIHRSQGSEFNKVAVILPPEDSKLLSRELLYVAVSRAKEKVYLVGSEESLIASVKRKETQNSGVWELMNHSNAKL
jgi:exodeoxyribonuclease V alpha subunit